MVSNMIDCQDGILALCMHSGKVHNILIKCAAPPLPPPPTKIKTKQNINTNQQDQCFSKDLMIDTILAESHITTTTPPPLPTKFPLSHSQDI